MALVFPDAPPPESIWRTGGRGRAAGIGLHAGPQQSSITNHLDQLESESIDFLREAFTLIDKRTTLWRSARTRTMLWHAKTAFFGHVPFVRWYTSTPATNFAEI